MLGPFGWKNKGEPEAKPLNASNLEEDRSEIGAYVPTNGGAKERRIIAAVLS